MSLPSPYHPLIVTLVIFAALFLKSISAGIFTLLFAIVGLSISVLFGVVMVGSRRHGISVNLGWLANTSFILVFGTLGDTDTHRTLVGFAELLRYGLGIRLSIDLAYSWMISAACLLVLTVVLVLIGIQREAAVSKDSRNRSRSAG